MIPSDNILVIATNTKNYLPVLLLIVGTLYIIYIIASLEVQNIRVGKLKEIIRLIEEGHAKKERHKSLLKRRR